VFALVAAGLCNAALASDASPDRGSPPDRDALEEVIVSVTPLLGTGVSLNHVPSNVQTLRAAQIDSDHAQALTDSMDRHLSSVTLADTEGNAFQQDLVARGFIASPVLGTPQGLALYQNGVRINEAFGDIVLWDLVPAFAIGQLQELPGSNPVFGLNALGGAVTLKMKDGFTYSGSAADIDGGSFGRVRATAQTATDGDPTGNGAFPNFTNSRFYTPGQPVGCWLGAKLRYRCGDDEPRSGRRGGCIRGNLGLDT
jgi:hypothetical protein